ncbi:low affinity iron permease family protein [Neorhizobium alkalisoli]|uniref:low affinity iron permease family protein n=1 Tax=Neorhizobium alkalisoli TaxID=528178 RepID=UPI000CF9514A|nr:low affinity iron permease family protein [Neorhizobium alkalisoli]
MSSSNGHNNIFDRFSTAVAEWSGKPIAFVLAVMLIVIWALTGPVFGFSETWQLVVNTATTIVTFVMVFVLQNSQNRDGRAVQAKLDELILTSQAANKFVGIEKLDERELRKLSDRLEEQAKVLDDHADDIEEGQTGTRPSLSPDGIRSSVPEVPGEDVDVQRPEKRSAAE